MSDILSSQILIIDDRPANIETLRGFLELGGFTNITAQTNPLKALKLIDDHSFDLILTDLMMPQIDGFEVLNHLQNHPLNGKTPTLVLTAVREETEEVKAFELGARDFLSKPFSRAKVTSRCQNFLQMSAQQRQLEHQKQWLEDEVRRKTAKLRHTQKQLLRQLGRAGEFKDNETGLHVVRMSLFAQQIGRTLGLSDSKAKQLRDVAPMHDIGKIGIPDNVLLKPGKLDDAEWKIMRCHPGIGARILGKDPCDLMKKAREVALSHHERWDGTGYPKGHKGESIPLFGRICAVADVYDALTTHRPYKKPWPEEEALAFVTQNSETHFDPMVVQAFTQSYGQILEIKHQYTETEQEIAS